MCNNVAFNCIIVFSNKKNYFIFRLLNLVVSKAVMIMKHSKLCFIKALVLLFILPLRFPRRTSIATNMNI